MASRAAVYRDSLEHGVKQLIPAMDTTLLTLLTETWLMKTTLIPWTAKRFQKPAGIVSKELQEQDCQLSVNQVKMNHFQYG